MLYNHSSVTTSPEKQDLNSRKCVDSAAPRLRESDVRKRLQSETSIFAANRRHMWLTDVVFPYFFRNLYIGTILEEVNNDVKEQNINQHTDSTHKQASVETEFHVGCSGCLCTSSGDVLTNIRCRNEDFRQTDRIIRQEEHRQILLRFRVLVNNASNIHNEANCLESVRDRSLKNQLGITSLAM